MPAVSYALIVRPDPQAAGRYIALCPDIPGWFATGDSPSEAGTMGAEIVRGIISERRASGAKVPTVRTHTVQVTVAAPPDSPSAPPPAPQNPKPVTALHESEGFQALASVVAQSREQHRAQNNGEEYTLTSEMESERVIKSDRLGPRK